MSEHVRALMMAAALVAVGAAVYDVPEAGAIPEGGQWWWLLAGFALVVVASLRRPLVYGPEAPAQRPAGRARWWTGLVLALAGAALWIVATYSFYQDWRGEFDRTWIAWLAGTALLGVGCDLLAGRWSAPPTRRTAAVGVAFLLTVLVAAVLRLANIVEFPGPAGITQIEDLQFGNWGAQWLAGSRSRWEFIGMAWVSALSIWIGGPDLTVMRIGYAIAGSVAVGAVMLWLRFSAGTIAAMVGTAFFLVSSWDIVVARIGFNPDILVIGFLFALVVGPARRGRPSAYIWIGFLAGFLLWEYIAYRPAAAFAVAGAIYLSLRDKAVGWPTRILRPLLMIALVVMMCIPLFGNRMKGRIADEYLNGLNRARAQRHYYNEEFDWRKIVDLRIQRTLDTTGLLFFRGDKSPARNVERRPLVDAASATLMLVGFAYCIANPFSQLLGLFAVGFVLTSIGSMIVTADFNPLRFSVTIPYLYYFVGLGGLALVRSWERPWGKLGRGLAGVVLVAGLAWATYDNATFLRDYWSNHKVREAVRNHLAYLTGWIGRNARDGEQVIGAGWRSSNALIGNDAAWLRGGDIPGNMEWDFSTAIERWTDPGPTLFVLFNGVDTRDTVKAAQYLIPELEMTFIEDDLGSHLAYARVPDRPASLDTALDYLRCNGIRAEYSFVQRDKSVSKRIDRVQPLVGLGSWPSEVVKAAYRGHRPDRIGIRYRARFRVENPGKYRFDAVMYHGNVVLKVDGRGIKVGGVKELEAGMHEFEAVADLAGLPAGIMARLFWNGPDSGHRDELIPFYRIAEPVPPCVIEQSSEAPAAAAAAARRPQNP